MNPSKQCLIWGSQADAVSLRGEFYFVRNSPRSGGNYVINIDVGWHISEGQLTDDQKARLTTMLVDQRRRTGEEWPLVTPSVIEKAMNTPMLPIQERADRLLRYIAECSSNRIGQSVPILYVRDPIQLGGLAWSDSVNHSELEYLCKYLSKNNWIELPLNIDGGPPPTTLVTVEGYSRIEGQRTQLDSSQAFIAMWFHESVDEAFEDGIEPAIEQAGYKALRIDRKEHVNKIDDEIIAEIRRSRFLVADFTQGSEGMRGGVYYEAGYARGLGLPVIFTCHEDSLCHLHFDTNHFNHIVWTDPADLREKLKNRILHVIGQGPETPTNS